MDIKVFQIIVTYLWEKVVKSWLTEQDGSKIYEILIVSFCV